MNTIKLYTLEEAANLLCCTTTWYNKQLRQGKFPGHKIGRKWMLTQEDINQTIILTAQPTVSTFNSLTKSSSRKLKNTHRVIN